ncbi:protein-glutamate O-methyltransferase [Actinoplanes sp. OR16]|uniref:CheR family methyltransferase n=1 Tax=Actinoplanes sp. OR16 TaxID=946334 RepID=UPI000F6ED3FD|nr:protein-glutamate O-methyltransferase CheR [Actinoplanes sp. OR16]BBH71050.1 protein-glutamate O-methyltransferase [Actinoplanes sp. OR16]
MIRGSDLSRFWELLQRRLGWTPTDQDGAQTAAVLTERATAHAMTEREYLNRLAQSGWDSETAELADALSITETYFFRHGDQFRILREEALPERIRAREGQRVLRLISVACSSGEEAYSLAIEAYRARPGSDWIVSVTGVDANRRMLEKARGAVYAEWSLRETPDDVRRRWFRETGTGLRVVPEVASTVQFAEQNLAAEAPMLWQPGRYDVIFCRNVLMYLTPAVAGRLIQNLTNSLAEGGYLFLGHTDSLGSSPEGLEVCHDGGTVFYRRSSPTPRPAPTQATPARGETTPARRVATPVADAYPRALDLFRDDRFSEALDLLENPGDIREILLRGVLLAQSGRVAEARDTAHRLMEIGGPHPDAHHLLGACHELDCADQAVGQYRLAAYLDPAFAMPRLRLGLLSRRRGDDRGAVAHLQPALELLVREEEDRIVLFGGGFGRLALTTLCRTELEACGVRR